MARSAVVFHCITLIVLVFFATTSAKANGVTVGIRALGITVGGTARCSATVTGNNPATSAPLANVTVIATLGGQPVATVITNGNGSFNINLNSLTNIATHVGTYVVQGLKVVIPLPIQGCPTWANVTTGRLQANVTVPLNIVGSLVNGILPLSVTPIIALFLRERKGLFNGLEATS